MFLLMRRMTSSVIGKWTTGSRSGGIWEGSVLLTLTLPPCPLLYTHPHGGRLEVNTGKCSTSSSGSWALGSSLWWGEDQCNPLCTPQQKLKEEVVLFFSASSDSAIPPSWFPSITVWSTLWLVACLGFLRKPSAWTWEKMRGPFKHFICTQNWLIQFWGKPSCWNLVADYHFLWK